MAKLIPLPPTGIKCIQIHTYGTLAGLRCTNYAGSNEQYCSECSHYRRYAQLTKEDRKTQCKYIIESGPLKGQRCVAKGSENGFCEKCLLMVTQYSKYVQTHYFESVQEEEDEDEEAYKEIYQEFQSIKIAGIPSKEYCTGVDDEGQPCPNNADKDGFCKVCFPKFTD